MDADFARGETTGTPEGKPELAEGHTGQGLMVGDIGGSAGVLYKVQDNFEFERGTLAMWVRPLNWRGDDNVYRLLFQAWPEAGGQFLLYKYPPPATALSFFLEPPDGGWGKMYARSAIKDWEPGQWHHVTCTWTRYEGMALYVDGALVQHLAGVGLLDGPIKPDMRLGGDWQRNGGRTVLDDVMIFDRMLSPTEVVVLAGRADDPPENPRPDDIPGVMLAHAYLGQKVIARVWSDCLGDPPVEQARLTLTPEAGGDPLAETRADLHGLSTLELDLTDVPHGIYTAEVSLLRGGQVAGAERLEVSKETDDTWETAAKIGREDTVLPPFEPLAVDGGRVACYAKQYVFGGSGLPDAITARDAPMLAGPVRVVATSGGRELPLAAGQLTVRALSLVQADLSGSLSGGGLDVQTRSAARYDGTVWHTLRFAPRGGLQLDSLRIELPLSPEQAEFLCYVAPGRLDAKRWGYGALPQGEGVVWSREFLPSLWLGTEDRGLGWYAESDQHWDIEGEDALTIERRPDATVLSMNIIRQPRTPQGEFTIEFGLQATPVRPLEPGWRSCQWLPSPDISAFFLSLRTRPYPRPDLEGREPRGKVCYLYTHHKYFTDTLPRDPGEFREMIERAKGWGLLTTPYTEARLLPESAGDCLMYREGMLADPPVRAVTYGPVCTAGGCHQGLFGDWFVWYISHMQRQYGSNGIYLDEMWPNGCANPAHGCGYVGPDGKRRKTYALRACQESYRRLRQLFADTGEPFWITYHISAGRVPPLPTFGDCLLIAEERYGVVGQNPDYLENTTLDEWRASFCPEAWGIPIVAIPQFKMNAEWMKDPDLAHRMMAAVVPHDVMVWPVFANVDAIMQIRDPLMAFGIGETDVTFLPYWQGDTGVSCGDERAIVSAYLRPGKLMLCVANRSKDEIAGLPVALDLQALGLPGQVTATDAVRGEEVPVVGTRLTVPMPPESLRLLLVQ
ncbi:MAG TPA: glycoside hydrolase domain-containing protein, partial [Armatimonadota bacterium]|nr:glycoside hydrolase domain-containing protein [Armatimonadota bacterium]